MGTKNRQANGEQVIEITVYQGRVKTGGKSPVGAYKRVETLQFFSCFQNNSYRIIQKG